MFIGDGHRNRVTVLIDSTAPFDTIQITFNFSYVEIFIITFSEGGEEAPLLGSEKGGALTGTQGEPNSLSQNGKTEII